MLPDWVLCYQVSLSKIHAAAKKHRVPTRFILATIQQESGCIPFVEHGGKQYVVAQRPEPNWRYFTTVKGIPISREDAKKQLPQEEFDLQSSSLGMMQIMGSVARELGFTGRLSDLLEVETNLFWGCKKIARLIEKHKALEDVAEAYNSGRAIPGPESRVPLYTDSVMKYYAELTGGK